MRENITATKLIGNYQVGNFYYTTTEDVQIKISDISTEVTFRHSEDILLILENNVTAVMGSSFPAFNEFDGAIIFDEDNEFQAIAFIDYPILGLIAIVGLVCKKNIVKIRKIGRIKT
ncbi:MAG: hypothetical protein INQ03_10510 [Candidatus Heimdallarchaeota archaeon]|nr:hypothetical protein [Candidatus Heimdallarchaeota archaeon]